MDNLLLLLLVYDVIYYKFVNAKYTRKSIKIMVKLNNNSSIFIWSLFLELNALSKGILLL